MAEDFRQEDSPRQVSRETLIRYLNGNRKVASIEEQSWQVLIVRRWEMPSVRLYLTNIYTVSIADVCRILADEPDTNAIVTVSNWNRYTAEAKEYSRENRIGLFTFSELMGAIHYDGDKFVNYAPPDPEKKRRHPVWG